MTQFVTLPVALMIKLRMCFRCKCKTSCHVKPLISLVFLFVGNVTAPPVLPNIGCIKHD